LGVLPGSGLGTASATLYTTPSRVNVSGVAPGAGLALTVMLRAMYSDSGTALALGLAVAKAPTKKLSTPIGAVTLSVQV